MAQAGTVEPPHSQAMPDREDAVKSTNNLIAVRTYLDLTKKERSEIARGACKNPYHDAKVPLRSSNGQIQRHVPLRHDASRPNVIAALILPIAFRFVDATVHEAVRYAAERWEQRKGRSSHEEVAHPENDGARSISQDGASVYPDAEILDLRAARERRASVG
jgi:hypothetical protein